MNTKEIENKINESNDNIGDISQEAIKKGIEDIIGELDSDLLDDDEDSYADELMKEFEEEKKNPKEKVESKPVFTPNNEFHEVKSVTEEVKEENITNNKTTSQVIEIKEEIKPTYEDKKFNDKTTIVQNNKDFIKNINVDLNSIDIIDVDPLHDLDNFKFLLNDKTRSQVIAVQSGYLGYVEGLNFNEINSLSNSTLDEYGAELLLLQTIYKRINSTSRGKISFDEWIKTTSYYDLESFIYGIYLETFPGDTHFNVTCGKCKKRIPAVINNDTLITSKNKETEERLLHIMNDSKDPKLQKILLNEAIIHKKKRLFLEDSKLIVDIKIPTLEKRLNMISSINPEIRKSQEGIFTLLLFFEDVFMLDVRQTVTTRKPKYYKVEDRERIAKIIGELTYKDSNYLSTQINDFINLYTLQYRIKSFKCPHCGITINDIPVDLEYLLFFQIQQ